MTNGDGTSGTGKKTISKNDAFSLKMDSTELKKYATDVLPSGNISKTQYKVTDWIGLVKADISPDSK